MLIDGERAAEQDPFLRYAQEAGWTHLIAEQALDQRCGVASTALDDGKAHK